MVYTVMISSIFFKSILWSGVSISYKLSNIPMSLLLLLNLSSSILNLSWIFVIHVSLMSLQDLSLAYLSWLNTVLHTSSPSPSKLSLYYFSWIPYTFWPLGYCACCPWCFLINSAFVIQMPLLPETVTNPV